MADTNFGVIDISALGSPSVAKVNRSLAAARRDLAAEWLSLADGEAEREYSGRLGQVHRMLASSGLRELPQAADDRAFIDRLKAELARDEPRRASPGKLIAAMLFLYPHELPHAYEAGAVPQWLLQDYMPYMLAAPPMFREAGEAQAWCEYATRWTTCRLRGRSESASAWESSRRIIRRRPRPTPRFPFTGIWTARSSR